MEPLTSAILNIQIVSMRKEVRKAVVHQIHGHTHKINKLRLKKGTEEQLAKNSLKADKLVLEVQILKKMKPDDVSLFILTNHEEDYLKSLIAKQVISTETRTIAKLCLRDNLQKVTKEFIKKYENSVDLLNELLNERYNRKEDAKSKKKKKPKVKKNKAKLKSSSDPSTVEMNQEVANSEDEISDSSDIIPKLVPIGSNNKSAKVDDSYQSDDSADNEDVSFHNDGNISDDNMSSSEPEPSEELEEVTKISLGRPKTFNSTSKGKGPKKPMNKEDKSNGTIQTVERHTTERMKVDPFFMTKENSEYLTHCDVKNDLVEEKDLSSENTGSGNNLTFKRKNHENFRGKNNPANYRSDTRRFSKSNDYRSDTKRFSKSNDKRNFEFQQNKGQRQQNRSEFGTHPYAREKHSGFSSGNRKDRRSAINKPEMNVKLHPSWEAKKKLNQPPIPFQGKKIKFDE